MKALKYVGLIAILPLLTVALTSYLGEAEAISREGIRHDNVVLPEPEPDVSLSLKMLGEPRMTGDAPVKSYKGFNEEQYDDTPTFRTVYLVQNEGKDKVWNIEILVKSDKETVSGKLLGKLDPKHATISLMIEAEDPGSISAKIVGFETTQDSYRPN